MNKLNKKAFDQLLSIAETIAVELTVRKKTEDNSDLRLQLGLALKVLNISDISHLK